MLLCFKLPGAIVHMEKEGPAFPVVPSMKARNMETSTLVIG